MSALLFEPEGGAYIFSRFLIDMKHFTLHHYQRKMEQEKEELKSYIENDSKTMKEKLDKVRLFISTKILC